MQVSIKSGQLNSINSCVDMLSSEFEMSSVSLCLDNDYATMVARHLQQISVTSNIFLYLSSPLMNTNCCIKSESVGHIQVEKVMHVVIIAYLHKYLQNALQTSRLIILLCFQTLNRTDCYQIAMRQK